MDILTEMALAKSCNGAFGEITRKGWRKCHEELRQEDWATNSLDGIKTARDIRFSKG